MNLFQIISFTHRQFDFDEIGLFHLEDSIRIQSLTKIKSFLGAEELMYLSTCNRVEFIVLKKDKLKDENISDLLQFFQERNTDLNILNFMDRVEVSHNEKAIHHLFSVASSLDSLVVGEREIITQVRKAFEECKDNGLCDDVTRVLVQLAIQTAKKVYTESKIANRPVSVVSLAYLELKKFIVHKPKRFLIVGAGKTVASMLKFISKSQKHEYVIYNRSVDKAQQLSDQLNLKAKVCPLTELGKNKEDFDYVISCTGAKDVVLDLEKYDNVNPDRNKSIIVDLAVPKDCSEEFSKIDNVKMINVAQLKQRADENLKARSKEIDGCLEIIENQIFEYNAIEKERELERAMQAVPESIKGIRKKAYAEVFAKELAGLDPDAREVLDSLVNYMEKKYISVPMKMAKEILLKESIK